MRIFMLVRMTLAADGIDHTDQNTMKKIVLSALSANVRGGTSLSRLKKLIGNDRAVEVRPAVAEKLPSVAHLADLVHIEVGNDSSS